MMSLLLRKKSADALLIFSSTRLKMRLLHSCGSQKMMLHSSSYMRAANMSNKNAPLLNHGREQLSSSSLRRSYLIPIAVLGGIGGGLLLMHINDEKRAIRRGECRNDGCSTRYGPVIGGPFRLIGSDGRLVTEKDLQGGDWILFYFGYTSSPDFGPAELVKLAKAIDMLDSKYNIKVRPVFVTIDPQRDNPSHLHAYLKGQFLFEVAKAKAEYQFVLHTN